MRDLAYIMLLFGLAAGVVLGTVFGAIGWWWGCGVLAVLFTGAGVVYTRRANRAIDALPVVPPQPTDTPLAYRHDA